MSAPFYSIHLHSAEQLTETSNDSVHFIFAAPPLWSHLRYGEETEDLASAVDYDTFLTQMQHVFAECFRVLMPGRCMTLLALDSFALAADQKIDHLHTSSHDFLRLAEAAGFSLWQEHYYLIRPGKSRPYLPADSNPHRRHDQELLPRYQKLYVLGKGIPTERPEWLNQALIAGYWKPTSKLRLPTTLLGSRYLYSLATKLIRPLRHSPRGVVQNWYDALRYWLLRDQSHRYPGATDRVLVQRLLRLYSQLGETVLDPFLGSGTTLIESVKAGRSCIGYEINQAVRPLIEAELGSETMVTWAGEQTQ